MIVDGKPKIETKTTINIKDDKWANIFSVYSSNFVTMVYGPIAAFLVEMFPAKLDTHPCHYHTM
jgi:hypothetical protein